MIYDGLWNLKHMEESVTVTESENVLHFSAKVLAKTTNIGEPDNIIVNRAYIMCNILSNNFLKSNRRRIVTVFFNDISN